ncbi:hypothetical protein SDC9_182706 [bioreactor metagenome]|uniref:Uncharacterized protein n=1 Tax=bioreactor metagenome TaxID=1076179 RepID=A0A645HAR0_9ZZZZ
MLAAAGCSGPVDASALAGVHFNKTVGQVPGLNFFQCHLTAFHAVHRDITVPGVFGVHAGNDTARNREEPCPFAAFVFTVRLKLYLLVLHPALQVFKGQHHITDAVNTGFFFFRDARADKHGRSTRVLLFDQLAVCQHGGEHPRKVGQGTGVIFLDQCVDRMAARRNDHRVVAVCDQLFILFFDNARTDGGFFCPGKPQLAQRAAYRAKVANAKL